MADLFLSMNKCAGVVATSMTTEQAQRALLSRTVKKVQEALERSLTSTVNIKEFLRDPLSETWLALDKDNNIVDAGYGILKQDGSYAKKGLQREGYQYAKVIFEALGRTRDAVLSS
jgi:hypothetical protein